MNFNDYLINSNNRFFQAIAVLFYGLPLTKDKKLITHNTDIEFPSIKNSIQIDYSRKDHNGNIYAYIDLNNNIHYFPISDKIKVNFIGKNSTVVVYEPKSYNKINITVNSNSFHYIERAIRISSLTILSRFFETTCFIGSDFRCEGATLILDENKNIYIGNDCLFSYGIEIRSSDGHAIIDIDENIINHPQHVIIKNHVWLGQGCTVLKGTYIEDNSIVGTKAVLSGKFIEKGSIIVGSPAKVIKTGASWKTGSPTFLQKSANK